MILIFTFADAGERDKFEYLYNKYKDLLYYKAWEILRDPMAAEDAVSETFIRVYRNMDKVEDPDSPRSAAFLVTIARNAALTIYKRRAGEPAPFASEAEDGADGFEDIADAACLEESVIAGISEEAICLIVGELDEESRAIFVMKYAYDLSHREIAAQLLLTENNVTVKLHRAKKKLAEMVRTRGLA